MNKRFLYILLFLCPLLLWGQNRLTQSPGDYRVNGGIRLANTSWTSPGLLKYHTNTWWGYNGTTWIDIGTKEWSSILSKPTTLLGYGITDALPTSHVAAGITSGAILNWQNAYDRTRYIDYALDSTTIPGEPGSFGPGVDSTYYTLPTYGGTTYYINPTPGTPAGTGTFESPYNSWAGITFTANSTYLQLRGTTYNSPGSITPGTGLNVAVKFGAYGDSTLPRPKIVVANTDPVLRLTGNHTYLIKDLELQASRYGLGIRHDGPGIVWVYNCDIHGGNHNYWKYGPTTSQGTVKLLYSSFHDAWTDNMYADDIMELEIGHCHFYECNVAYFTYPGDDGPSAAPGDNIQLATAYGPLTFNIHHSILDHSSSGHKFAFIAWNGYTPADNAWNALNGLFTDNIVIGSRSKGFLGSNGCIYLGDMQAGDTVIFERNIITDGSIGIFMESSNVRASYNLIHNVGTGISLSQTGAKLVAHNNTLANYSSAAIGAVSSTSVFSRNNAFSSGGAYAYNSNSTYDSDYNYFQGFVANGSTTLASWQGSTTNDDNSLTGDPLFKDPATADYRPNTGSPLLNAGADIGYSYDLSRDIVTAPPSIGAYENIEPPDEGDFTPGTPDTYAVDTAMVVKDIKFIIGDHSSGNYAEFLNGDLYFRGTSDLKLDWRNTPLARGETGQIQYNEAGLLAADTSLTYSASTRTLTVPGLKTNLITFPDNTTLSTASGGGGSGNFLVSTIENGSTLPDPAPDILYIKSDTILNDTPVPITIPSGYAVTSVYWDNFTTVTELNTIINGADNISTGPLTPGKSFQPINSTYAINQTSSIEITGNESPGVAATLKLEKTPFYVYEEPSPPMPPYLDGNTATWLAGDTAAFYKLASSNVNILYDKAQRKTLSDTELLTLPLDFTVAQWTKSGTVTGHTATTFTTSAAGGVYRLFSFPIRSVISVTFTGTISAGQLLAYNNNNALSSGLIGEAGSGANHFSSVGNYFYFRATAASTSSITSATAQRVNGNHVSHSTTANQPTFADGTVSFNGTTQWLRSATGTTITYQHAFVVGRIGTGEYQLYTTINGFGDLTSGVLTLGASGESSPTTFYDVDIKEVVLRSDNNPTINTQIRNYLMHKYSVTLAP